MGDPRTRPRNERKGQQMPTRLPHHAARQSRLPEQRHGRALSQAPRNNKEIRSEGRQKSLSSSSPSTPVPVMPVLAPEEEEVDEKMRQKDLPLYRLVVRRLPRLEEEKGHREQQIASRSSSVRFRQVPLQTGADNGGTEPPHIHVCPETLKRVPRRVVQPPDTVYDLRGNQVASQLLPGSRGCRKSGEPQKGHPPASLSTSVCTQRRRNLGRKDKKTNSNRDGASSIAGFISRELGLRPTG